MNQAVDIKELNERIQKESSFVDMVTIEMNKVIIGQKHLVESLLIGLLSNGHILLEGVPGLAKTLAIKSLAQTISARYSRIQFTPDLLPADLLGTMIYSQKKEEFTIKKGPIFANFYLLMRSTVLLQRFSQLCWKPCRNARLLLVTIRLNLTNHF